MIQIVKTAGLAIALIIAASVLIIIYNACILFLPGPWNYVSAVVILFLLAYVAVREVV